MNTKANCRRYYLELGIAMSLYVVATFTMRLWVNHIPDGSPLRIVAALVPLLPVLGALWAVVRYVQRGDELMQKVQMMAAVYALCTVIILNIGLGFLQAWAGVEMISGFWVGCGAVLVWGMLPDLLMRRYQ